MITPAASPVVSPSDQSAAASSQPQPSASTDSPFATLLAGTAQSQTQTAESAPATNPANSVAAAKSGGAKNAPAKAAASQTEDTTDDAPDGSATAEASSQQVLIVSSLAPVPVLAAESGVTAPPVAAIPTEANTPLQSAAETGHQTTDPQTPNPAPAAAAADSLAGTTAPTIEAAPSTVTNNAAPQIVAANAPAPAATKPVTDNKPVTDTKAAEANQTTDANRTADSQSLNPAQPLDAATSAAAASAVPVSQTTNIADAASAVLTGQANVAATQPAQTIVAQTVNAVLANASDSANAQSADAAPSATATNSSVTAQVDPTAPSASADSGAVNASASRATPHAAPNQSIAAVREQSTAAGNAVSSPAQTTNTPAAAAPTNHVSAQPAQSTAAPIAAATDPAPANLGTLIAQTNAAPPPQADAPVHIAVTPGVPSDWQALAVRIASHSQDGASQFTIRLDPPALGRIDVRLHVDAQGQGQAQLSADRPQTLQLLQKDAPALERALKDAGVDLGNGLSFSLNGNGRQAQERSADQGRGRYARITAVDAADGASPVLAARWSGRIFGDTSRVDITV